MSPRRPSRPDGEPVPTPDGGESFASVIAEHLALTGRSPSPGPEVPREAAAVDVDPADVAGPGAPRFLFGELVRLTATTGTKSDERGVRSDARPLVGRASVVEGASPAADESGWIIHLRADVPDAACDVPEAVLEPTGLIEVIDEFGAAALVPLDPDRHRGWRDDVMVEIETGTESEAEAGRLAESVVGAIRRLVGDEVIDWRLDEPRKAPFSLTVWIYTAVDGLELYERLVAAAEGEWQDDEDGVFVSSRWTGHRGRVFLVPGISSAEVTYRRWTTPKRAPRSPTA